MNTYDLGPAAPPLPCILVADGLLTACAGIGMDAMGMRFLDARTMVCKEMQPVELPIWLVDYDGKLREFRLRGKRREWARPLRWLWRWTLSEFEAVPPRTITAGELRDLVDPIQDEEFHEPMVADLKQFLDSIPRDRLVDRELLTEWNI